MSGPPPLSSIIAPMPRDSTLFENAIDVPLWLEADRLTPYAERARRDREIARNVPQGDRIARVRAWWQARVQHARKARGRVSSGCGRS